jgi:transcriptional regulator with GAF, ATPase, and Fis domain
MYCPEKTAMVENDLKAQVDNMIRIGIALSSQLDIDELLEMIVDESRRFTRADGGTLYILSDDKKFLRGKIVQNDTLGTRVLAAQARLKSTSRCLLQSRLP